MRRTIVPLMLLVAACRPATTELTDQRRAEIAAAVNARNAEYWDAWRAADWDRGMAFYADSPEFVWAAAGVIYYGKDRLEESRSAFARIASQTFAFRDSRTIVMAPDAAFVTALGTWAQADTSGASGPLRDFAWTALWLLRDGTWKMHVVHISYPAQALQAM